MKTQYEVIIIGGSYAGLAAAMALGRALREVLIIDSGHPCNATTPYSHNFLTQDRSTPATIAGMAKEQVLKYETIEFLHDKAIKAERNPDQFTVITENGKTVTGKKLVIATGIKDILLPIPGFAVCWGKTVIHCPYCHGYEVREQKTGILANGETAVELAMLVSNWTTDLTIYTNGRSTINEINKLRQHGIAIVETEIESLEHSHGILHAVQFKDGSMAEIKIIYARPAFEQHCVIPHALGCALTDAGYLRIDSAHRTTVEGVYACGDNTSRMRTVAGAVAQGTTTGMMVNRDFIEETF